MNACFHGSSFLVCRRIVRQPDREPRIIHGCKANIKAASGEAPGWLSCGYWNG
jgi:hypothetical protein